MLVYTGVQHLILENIKCRGLSKILMVDRISSVKLLASSHIEG